MCPAVCFSYSSLGIKVILDRLVGKMDGKGQSARHFTSDKKRENDKVKDQ